MKKLWRFGLFSRDKGDYIDVWMIKIMIKTNQILMWMYASFKSRDNIQKQCLSRKSGFFPFVYLFLSLTLTDEHGAKNLWVHIRPCVLNKGPFIGSVCSLPQVLGLQVI